MSNDEVQGSFDGIMSDGFGVIPKRVMLDRGLSIEAKGIYALLASFAGAGLEAWPSVAHQCYALGISEDRYKKHRQLLIAKGYIRIVPTRRNGKQGPNRYILASSPASISVVAGSKLQTPDFQTPENQGAEIQTPENKGTNNNSYKKEQIQKETYTNTHTHSEAVQPNPAASEEGYAPASAGASVCDDEWNEFLRLYPKPCPSRDLNKARKVFAHLLKDKGMAYIRAQVKLYVAFEEGQGRELRFWKNASAFLLEGWATREYPQSALSKVLAQSDGAVEISPEQEAAIQERLALKHGKWASELECPTCGTASKRVEGSALYECRTCNSAFRGKPLPKAVNQ